MYIPSMRPLGKEDLNAYVDHLARHHAESGRDGDSYSGPYRRDEPLPADIIHARTRERWSAPLDQPEWRRTWGCFDADQIVASASVTGGSIAADLHRVDLGVIVLRPYRRQGHGRTLVEAIVAWCRGQPSIAWIDLGVFGDNTAARALFASLGFTRVACTRDRWRVDGHSIDEIAMTMRVETEA